MPSSYTLPRVNFYLICKLFIALFCLQLKIAVADDFDKLTQSTSQTPVTLTAQEEFLPVTDAFKVNASFDSLADAANKKLRLTWTIAPRYYLYQERFAFQATPALSLNPVYSEGTAKFDEFAGKDMTVFHNSVTVDFTIPANSPAFDLRITSQGCADAGLCYPPYTQTLHLDPANGISSVVSNKTLPAKNVAVDSTLSDTAPNTESPLWLWQAIVLALLGGMILNLMPCVFPVLSIKALSLIQANNHQRRAHGWAYTLGILVCFIGFAIMLLAAKHGGEAIGWGFQLQSPGLVTALAYLFFIMGLSMSGMINIGTRWMGAGQSLTQQSGFTGSFFTGILAAVVASPCTAPFMGAALGFALTQPAIICIAVFAALGLGMALPLLLLCYLPQLARYLPNPGAWMETLKEILAFPLYLSAVWLLWVLTNQAGTQLMAGVCVGAIAIVFACWINNRSASGANLSLNKVFAIMAVIVAIALPYKLLHKGAQSSRWQPYSATLLKELRQQGKPVFIDLTADWCLTCLANEKVSLTKKEVEAAFEKHNVVTLRGDWTNRNAEISKLLEEYGRSGVPLYLWFPEGNATKGIVLPQLLTPSVVINAIEAKE